MLDSQRLTDPLTGLPSIVVILPLALDVACAMLHLHSEQLLHGDLKANNVLLSLGGCMFAVEQDAAVPAAPAAAAGAWVQQPPVQAGTPPQQQQADAGAAADPQQQQQAASQQQQQQQQRQVTAWYLDATVRQLAAKTRLVGKVADLGLSLALDSDATHVSHMHGVSQGAVWGGQGSGGWKGCGAVTPDTTSRMHEASVMCVWGGGGGVRRHKADVEGQMEDHVWF
jgi:serine/threonine protein kinase